MAVERRGYRGYVTCRPFGGLMIPVPVQALVLRDYCARHGKLYKLHVNENIFPHSYMVLEGLVTNLEGLEGILMCSMFMLPQRPERRAQIYAQILRQGADLRFVLEDMIISDQASIQPVEEILGIYGALQHCPTKISDASSANADLG